MPNSFEELSHTDLRDIPQDPTNMKAPVHETLEKPEVPKLPGRHAGVVDRTTNLDPPTTEDPASAFRACISQD